MFFSGTSQMSSSTTTATTTNRKVPSSSNDDSRNSDPTTTTITTRSSSGSYCWKIFRLSLAPWRNICKVLLTLVFLTVVLIGFLTIQKEENTQKQYTATKSITKDSHKSSSSSSSDIASVINNKTNLFVDAFSVSVQNYSSNKKMIASRMYQHRILAYGDSLTYGTVAYYNTNYPYASYLEKALQRLRGGSNNNNDNTTSSSNDVLVRYRGMPGWTAHQMLQDVDDPITGLRSAIQAVQDPSLSMVIILVGTNDMGYRYSEMDITNNIISLHQLCYDNHVPRTIAIGIPPSGYQHGNPAAADLAIRINQNLAQFCDNSNNRSIYFPFPFPYESKGELWDVDTLHFSQKGYQYLGESLAPTVNSILESLDNDNSDRT